jgi:hypothetical protein
MLKFVFSFVSEKRCSMYVKTNIILTHA